MKNLYTEKLNPKDAQDLTAFESIALPYQKRLYRTALILSKNPHRAKDLINETFAQAKKNYHRFEAGTNFGCWLSKILLNTFMKRY